MELLKSKPSPAGELFALSARDVKLLESTALLIGDVIDSVRRLTTTPLSAESRELVIAAFKESQALRAGAARLRRQLACAAGVGGRYLGRALCPIV